MSNYHKEEEYHHILKDLSIHIEHIIRKDIKSPKKILFVNGALATYKSYYWAKKELNNLDLIFYNLPHFIPDENGSGKGKHISLETEVDILIKMLKKYKPDFLISMSWGGYSALHALAQETEIVEKALIASFSGKITPEMKEFIIKQDRCIVDGDYDGAIDLFNNNIGKYLHNTIKRAYKRYFKDLSRNKNLLAHLLQHFRNLLKMDPEKHMNKFSEIAANVLFLNGKLDDYTPGRHVKDLCRIIPDCSLKMVDNASHFLILENHKTASEVKGIIRDFFS